MRIAEITDGTSNVIMLGEQSDFATDSSGDKVEMRSSAPFSLVACCNFNGVPTVDANSGDQAYHLTTIRYPLNDKTYDSTRANGKGNSDPVNLGGETNKPLQSIHPGMVNVLLGDGSVRSVSENINFGTYLTLCERASGEVVGEW